MNSRYFGMALTVLVLNGLSTFGGTGIIARGGLSLANQSIIPSGSVSTDNRTGFHFVVLGEQPVNPNMNVLYGGGFETKGFSSSQNSGGYTLALTKNVNYLIFPVMLSFGTYPMGITSRLFLNAGFEPSMLLSAISNQTFTGSINKDTTTDNRSSYNDFDLCMRGEVGVETPVSIGLNGVFGVGASHGLTNAATSAVKTTSGKATTIQDYVFEIFAGVKFK